MIRPFLFQYFYLSVMVAMIGTVIFIRMNWLIKFLLNLIAFIVYAVVVLDIRNCLFDNYDKVVFGFCTSCDQFIETKTSSSILLFTVFCATVLLGRHVSYLESLCKPLRSCDCYRWITPTGWHFCGNKRLFSPSAMLWCIMY